MRMARFIFYLILTLSLFSFWAGTALLVVNPLFHRDLPGYTIGRLCIWELVAIILCALLAKLIIRKWGNIDIVGREGERKLNLNVNYAIYFSIYFFIAVLVGVWQFWLFSQKF